MLIDNILFLKKYYPEIREELLKFEEQTKDSSAKIVDSKSGKTTLEILSKNGVVYLHSKYDPEKEAQRFIEQYKDSIQEYDHVFFYGVGLGYHIEAFMNQYPELSFTMYEPNAEILTNYLKLKKIEALPIKKLKTMHLEINEQDRLGFLNHFTDNLDENILLVPLPSYERIFANNYQTFIKEFKEIVKSNRSSLKTNIAFQKRWTINSMKNFPKVLETPNILKDVNNSYFRGENAILVSAGPSLSKEIDNLKIIKEKGLAYIFSVGSAINALIEYGVYPDAACTYDPTEKNEMVFRKLKNKNLKEIPLIYGSSVAYKVLEDYPGSMFHMLTSQDNVAQGLISDFENIETVIDAPSIAIVTYQLLLKLGFSRIILVGQDLAFNDKKRYATGIDYGDKINLISENEKNTLIKVNDVYGKQTETTESFLMMKKVLEEYIKIQGGNVENINTSKGGADIIGTKFMTLDNVVTEILLNKENSVNHNWVQANSNYDLDNISDKLIRFNKSKIQLKEQIDEIINIIVKVSQTKSVDSIKLEKKLNQFDKLYNKIIINDFYIYFISPMIRVQINSLLKSSKKIQYEVDTKRKIELILQYYGNFLDDLSKHYDYVLPFFNDVDSYVNNLKANE